RPGSTSPWSTGTSPWKGSSRAWSGRSTPCPTAWSGSGAWMFSRSSSRPPSWRPSVMPLEDLHGKAILVTGATGVLGAHLVGRLRRVPDARLLLMSRRGCPGVRPAGETWVTAPLAEVTERTWRAAGFGGIDVVFHLGGFTPKVASQADDVARVYE